MTRSTVPPESRAERLARFTDEQLAYHEAGHAVLHHLQGGVVTRLSIERDDAQGTHVGPRPAPAPAADPQATLRDLVALLIAGEVAATIRGAPEEVVAAGGAVDRAAAVRAAAEMGVDEAAARAMIDAAWPRVRARLEEPDNWTLVERAAQALLREKTLVADLFRATIGR
jgi:hypothetical protein